jgi:hypothetical protein
MTQEVQFNIHIIKFNQNNNNNNNNNNNYYYYYYIKRRIREEPKHCLLAYLGPLIGTVKLILSVSKT